MASKSSRTITKQQFSDGTTIDGNRLDTAMEDVKNRVEKIGKGDLLRRWLQTQYVLTFWPANADQFGFVTRYPFMTTRNVADDDVVSAGNLRNIVGPLGEYNQLWMKDLDPTDYVVRNELRMKGMLHDRHKIVLHTTSIYTSTHFCSHPTILEGLSIVNHREPIAHTRYSDDDLSVVVLMDNPYSPENRLHNQKLLAKHKISGLTSDAFDTHDAVNAAEPLWELNGNSTEGTYGAYIDLQQERIIIPAGARIRVMIGQGNQEEHKFAFTATLTLMEEIEA